MTYWKTDDQPTEGGGNGKDYATGQFAYRLRPLDDLALSLARMVFEDFAVPGGGVDVGVDFGGGDAFVAEHFLDKAEVGAALDEVGREGVAEGVGGDFLADVGYEGLGLDHLEHGLAAETPAEAVEEEEVGGGGIGGVGAALEIGIDGIHGHFAYRHKPFLVAFSYDSYESVIEIEAGNPETHSFRDAEAAAVEDFEDGAVAQTLPCGDVNRIDYGCDLIF